MKKRKIRLTAISTFHYFRLVYRSLLFLAAAAFYIAYRFTNDERITVHLDKLPAILAVIWIVYVAEMILRFFRPRPADGRLYALIIPSPCPRKRFRQKKHSRCTDAAAVYRVF